MPSSATTSRGSARTPIPEPGEPSDDLSLGAGPERPERWRRLDADLARIRDAEIRAERDTEGIRLH